MSESKPTHIIVLDAGPIIKNIPAVSSLLAHSGSLVTTPTVLSEIRDATTRARVETLLKPFLTIQQPKPTSLQHVAAFARKTGDIAVLSKADMEIIALAYDLECERNGGDWRLRNSPGQKELNGPIPKKDVITAAEPSEPIEPNTQVESSDPVSNDVLHETSKLNLDGPSPASEAPLTTEDAQQPAPAVPEESIATADEPPEVPIKDATTDADTQIADEETSESQEDGSDSDSEGWITPSNLKKHQIKDAGGSVSDEVPQTVMQVATITTDYAMQNVLLQMGLNLLSTSLHRVRNLKNFVLRCHACFKTTKDMSKQFCPNCGKPTLTKVTCTTNSKGEFQIHLKKNFQWNTRGDRYSIPKPVHGAPHGRVEGGGKGHWGNDLILAEDQKEYVRAVSVEKRQKQRDLMDEDFLPSILTGQRNAATGRPKVGAGRNVNSRKR